MPHEESKQMRKVFIILMIVGLFLLLLGTALSIKMLVYDKIGKESTYGTILAYSDSATQVKYKVKNTTYIKTYSVYNSAYYVGKKIKIYYNKTNPYKSFVASMQYIILIVPGMGILLLGISGIGLIHVYMKYYKI